MKTPFKQFLEERADPSRPILLAISGGPDSLALLHLAIENGKQSQLSFGIAHVDHGWRPESRDEASQLEELARQFHIPFHLSVLEGGGDGGNLEDRARRCRLDFFGALCRSHGYQAVMTAHHADDAAETVLKRILEGAPLTKLAAIAPVSQVDGVVLWRPLLQFSKLELEDLARRLPIEPFTDSTNNDPRFLRGRFRTRILPLLSSEFGKEVRAPLCRIAAEAEELGRYLDGRTAKIMEAAVRGPMGTLVDVRSCSDSVEVKHIIRRLCSMEGFSLSADAVCDAARHVTGLSANKRAATKEGVLHIDRRILFAAKATAAAPVWHVEQSSQVYQGEPFVVGWPAVWRGRAEAYLPIGEYTIAPAEAGQRCLGTSTLDKTWNAAKVPAFLRKLAPVVWGGSAPVFDFLSGKVLFKPAIGESATRVTLRVFGIEGENFDVLQ